MIYMYNFRHIYSICMVLTSYVIYVDALYLHWFFLIIVHNSYSCQKCMHY